MSHSWDQDPDPESVERAMNRRIPLERLSLVIKRDQQQGCPRCSENKRVAEGYRNQRDHLKLLCDTYEKRIVRGETWRPVVLVVHVIAYTLAAWALTKLVPLTAARWAAYWR